MKLKFEILLQYNLKSATISSEKMVLLHAKEGMCYQSREQTDNISPYRQDNMDTSNDQKRHGYGRE